MGDIAQHDTDKRQIRQTRFETINPKSDRTSANPTASYTIQDKIVRRTSYYDLLVLGNALFSITRLRIDECDPQSNACSCCALE